MVCALRSTEYGYNTEKDEVSGQSINWRVVFSGVFEFLGGFVSKNIRIRIRRRRRRRQGRGRPVGSLTS